MKRLREATRRSRSSPYVEYGCVALPSLASLARFLE